MRRYTIVLALRSSRVPDASIPGHEFLMVRNTKRGGRLELPGGRVEARETPQEGARREFIEETGHGWSRPFLVQRRTGELGEGFVYVCALGPRLQPREDNISEVVFVPRLPGPHELSFPQDPYEELFAAVSERLATWQARADDP